jgi:uncharacterized protein YfaS (alpha-2-macroglobulin family)
MNAGERPMPAIRLLIVVCSLALLCSAAGAAEFELPGLAQDSDAYAESLQKIAPAGATRETRRRDEQQALDAANRKDWAGAAAAWERRLGEGESSADQWLALAEAQLNRAPPDTKRALQAAWRNYDLVATGPAQIPGLLLMSKALHIEGRAALEYRTLAAIVERAPENPGYRHMLDDARRSAGLLFDRLHTEAETDPPRACLSFTVPLNRRTDWQPTDWVTFDPPVAEAAVTREGDGLCVSGLPLGTTTQVKLRAGLPGEGDITLKQDAVVAVDMPNRNPRLVFDSRFFVLPRGQARAITLTTVNLSTVSLKLVRVSERNVVPFVRDNKLGAPVGSWSARQLEEDAGSVVWSGKADIPSWRPNVLTKTALPLPESLASSGPGLFALIAVPGDGTPDDDDSASAVQMILRTDLAPTVWRGSDGVTVQIRGYSDAAPKPGVRLALLAHNNDILAETATGADGIARFAAPLLHGEGPLEPFALYAFGAGQDFTAIDLNAAAFDLSDRGVSGQPQPKALDAFIWLDRGIYRPGETVNLMALLRSNAGEPMDLPVHVIVRRPNEQVFLDATPPRRSDAAIYLPVALSRSASAGTWTVEVRPDPKAPPIGRAEFKVESFVPDRMAVELGLLPGAIVPGRDYTMPVSARFLYGAPAANLGGTATMRLEVDPEPFPDLVGYHVGLVTETFAPNSVDLALPDTDADGHASLPVDLHAAPDTTFAVRAHVEVEVNDPSGHGARAEATIPVRPAGPLIGIRPRFADNAVNAGTEAAFDIAAVDPDGKRVALPAKLRLVREIPDWRLVMNGRLAQYETVWRDQPLETHEVTIPADRPLHFARPLDFGRYRLEVLQAGDGLAASSVRFWSGWASEDNPDVPDRAEVLSERREYRPGETARIHIAAPFAGQATVLALTDRVLWVQNVAISEDGTDVSVPVEASWGPGAYVTVHVFHPAASDKERPRRAIGLTWVGVDASARTLASTITIPEPVRPRRQTKVAVRTTPGAWVTLAAVDEGILRLTRFENPDPVGHFLGRRALGIDIRDDWGRLIAPAQGTATLLRQGAGGDEEVPGIPIPQAIVSLFTPPVQADADGAATIPLDFPDFDGQVRLMAVTWLGNRVGAAATNMFVRDPLVAELLLPRFLAPGDDARVAVLLHDIELPAGDVSAALSADGAIGFGGPVRFGWTLQPAQQEIGTALLHAERAGQGHVHIDVTGPAGFHSVRDVSIVVRPSRGAMTTVASSELAPGGESKIAPDSGQFVPGTWHASVSFGTAVRYDPAALLTSLDEYRFRCLEQETSRGLPLALLTGGTLGGSDRGVRLAAAVQSVLDRQRYDGGFGLWSASDEAQPWLSAYATEFLLHARDAGATVPEAALADAVKFLAKAADESADKPEDRAAQAYRLYVLALAGEPRAGAARVMAASLDQLPTPLARAQVGAALALANDRARAETLFTAAVSEPKRNYWGFDYGSALRDQLAVAFLLKRSNLLPEQLKALLGKLPGRLPPESIDTQEEAWAVAAAAALGAGAPPVRVAMNDKTVPPAPLVTLPLSGPAAVRNLGDASVWQTVSMTGVPTVAPPAARQGMRISRKFFALDGKPLDLGQLHQNTVFVLLLEGKAEDGQMHHALIVHGLPAGWEIAGRFAGGQVAGMSWLGELSTPLAEPSADDRYAAALDLTADQPAFRVAVRLRAVTPGSYALPGAELTDMYHPGIFARQAEGRITILPAK